MDGSVGDQLFTLMLDTGSAVVRSFTVLCNRCPQGQHLPYDPTVPLATTPLGTMTVAASLRHFTRPMSRLQQFQALWRPPRQSLERSSGRVISASLHKSASSSDLPARLLALVTPPLRLTESVQDGHFLLCAINFSPHARRMPAALRRLPVAVAALAPLSGYPAFARRAISPCCNSSPASIARVSGGLALQPWSFIHRGLAASHGTVAHARLWAACARGRGFVPSTPAPFLCPFLASTVGGVGFSLARGSLAPLACSFTNLLAGSATCGHHGAPSRAFLVKDDTYL